MDSAQIITIILAVITATGASLVTALFTRPKISAEARAATAGAEVQISADARAWAETFQQRANAAETKADAAEKAADDCAARVADLDRKMNLLLDYTIRLQGEVVTLGGHPPAAPDLLKPPLV